jgi:ABC-type sulfate transport system permease component
MLTHIARYTISTWSQAARIAWAVEASFAASTAIDMIISVAMCYYLRKSMGRERVLNSRISGLMVSLPYELPSFVLCFLSGAQWPRNGEWIMRLGVCEKLNEC